MDVERLYDLEVERDKLQIPDSNFVEHKSPAYSGNPTYSNFSPDEVKSAMQKAIRRGYLYDACQWALEMFRTGPNLRSNVWNRLLIISVEDVGPADPLAMIKVYHLWKTEKENPLALVTAVSILCTAKKCRINDNAVYFYPKGEFKGTLEEWTINLKIALENKSLGYALYYRTAMHRSEDKIKVEGRHRNIQYWFWKIIKDFVTENQKEYVNLVYEIATLPPFKWKDEAQMFENHIIFLIIKDKIPNKSIVEELKQNKTYLCDDLQLFNDLRLFVDHHQRRENLKGIPDYAKDKHTRSGRLLGRDYTHFFEVGAVLHNEDLEWKSLSDHFLSKLKNNMTEAGIWNAKTSCRNTI